MSLYRVRLELARSKEAPQGDPSHAYVFVAPLDAHGHLDASMWRSAKNRCVVERYKHGAPEQKGLLAHVGKGWHFDYDMSQRDDDEPLFKLDRHEIKQGEYVSITEHDGVMRTFKVVSVSALPS